MDKNLRFSIVVPIYNVEKFLDQCITSVLSQSYDNYELILVDDGATDNSGKICDAYALKNNHIRVIHKANGGLVSARRAGVMAAKGEYIGYVDGDDWVSDNWLAEVNKVITEAQPDIVEYNAFKSTDGKNVEMKTSHFRGFFGEQDVKEKIIPCMLCDRNQRFYTFGVLPAVWSKIIKTDILRANLCSEDKITFGEDVACIYNSVLDCKSFYGIDIPLYYYRQSSQSMTKAYDARRFERLGVLFTYLNKQLLQNNRHLKKQYNSYVLFCIFYAALNEAKNDTTFKEMDKKFEDGLKSLDLENFVNETTIRVGIPWNVMLYLIKKKRYRMLMVLCRMIVKVKYSYKA